LFLIVSFRIKELEGAISLLKKQRAARGSVGAADAPATATTDLPETPAETIIKRQQMRKRSSLSIIRHANFVGLCYPTAADFFSRPVLAVPIGYSFSDSLDAASKSEPPAAKEKSGWLILQEGTTWVRRWCTAKDGTLLAFASSKAVGDPVDRIELPVGGVIQRADRQTGKTNSFSLGPRFAVASSDDDFDEWMSWLTHLGCKLSE